MGRIENGLYCDGCYREKESLKKTDKIIKTAKEVNNYTKDSITGKKKKTDSKTTVYNWEIKKGRKRK